MTPEEMIVKLTNMEHDWKSGWPMMREQLDVIRQAAAMIGELNVKLKDALKTLDEKWTDQ